MKTINKKELAKTLSKKIGATQKDTMVILEELEHIVFNDMRAGNKVKLFDGVVLSGQCEDAKMVRRPLDGAMVKKDACIAPKCKFSAVFKDRLNDR